VPPCASDTGAPLGSALWHYHQTLRHPRGFELTHPFYGQSYSEVQIRKALDKAGLQYRRIPEAQMLRRVAQDLADGKIIGWFQGRMEAGPRALGNRSILADPRDPESKSRLNAKIKHREPFRPFAPSVLLERAGDYFVSDHPSPVMLLVYDVAAHRRAEVPAITHVDGSARVQTVARDENPGYWRLIKSFEEITGVPMVVNTSFNDNEEPIVCTPAEAVSCYLRTDMDALALGPFWTEKA